MVRQIGMIFSIKDLGDVGFFLGVQMIRTSTGLFLSQRQYVLDLLDRVGMSDCHHVATPMATRAFLHQDDSAHFTDVKLYEQVMGSLQYLSLTRLDLAFATNKLSQFAS